MKELISFLVKNFSLTFLCVGLVVSAASLLRRPGPLSKATVADKMLSDYILYTVGLMYLYNFVVHTALAETRAMFIGSANRPFQYEVGYASLGFGVAAIVAHGQRFRAAPKPNSPYPTSYCNRTIGPTNKHYMRSHNAIMYHEVVEVHEANRIENVMGKAFCPSDGPTFDSGPGRCRK